MILAITNLLFFLNLNYLLFFSKTKPNYLIYTLIGLGLLCVIFSALTIFDEI